MDHDPVARREMQIGNLLGGIVAPGVARNGRGGAGVEIENVELADIRHDIAGVYAVALGLDGRILRDVARNGLRDGGIIGAGNGHGHGVDRRRAVGVCGGDLDLDRAGLVLSQILEIAARIEAQRGAGDRRAALRGGAGDGIGQGGAVVVAIHVGAERRQVHVHGRAVLGGIGQRGGQRRVVICARHGDRDRVHRRCAVGVGGGDLDLDRAGLVLSQILEIAARIEAQCGAGDRRAALRGGAGDGVGQGGAVVVAIHVGAERREVHVHARAVLGGVRQRGRERRVVIGAGDGNRGSRLCRVAIRIGHFVDEIDITGLANGQIFKFAVRVEAEAAVRRAGRALGEHEHPCRRAGDQPHRIGEVRYIVIAQDRGEDRRSVVLVHGGGIVDRRDGIVRRVQLHAIDEDAQFLEFTDRKIEGRELESCGIRLAGYGIGVVGQELQVIGDV